MTKARMTKGRPGQIPAGLWLGWGPWFCILICLLLPAVQPARAGCYCMMQFKQSSTNWNKVGFGELGCSNSFPPKVFLYRTDILTYSASRIHTDDSGSDSESGGSSDNEVQYYDITQPFYAGGSSGVGCQVWQLPYHCTVVLKADGAFDVEGSDWGLYLFNHKDTTVDGTNTCDSGGSWTDYSDSGTTSGSTCDGWTIPWGSYSELYDAWFSAYITLDECDNAHSKEIIHNYGDPSDSGTTQDDVTTLVTTLDGEYTDQMLQGQIKSRLPTYPDGWTNGTGSAFYLFTDGDHKCAGGGHMKYRLEVPDSVLKTTYVLQWQEVTVYPDTTNINFSTQTASVIGNGGTAFSQPITVEMPDIPSYIYETAPDIIATIPAGSGDGGPTPGSGGPLGGGGGGSASGH